MNPFEAHETAMAELQAVYAEPIRDKTGGRVVYNSMEYPALVSAFNFQSVLRADGGGFTPMLMGSVIIQKGDVEAGTIFSTGQFIKTISVDGRERNCRIDSVNDNISHYELMLEDKNQGA